MGDRCYLEVTFREEDRSQFLAFMGGWRQRFDDEIEIEPDAVISAAARRISYGGYSELRALAAAGVPFYGQHSSGNSYFASVFASAGGEFVECNVMGGLPVVPIYEDGEPETGHLATVRNYWWLFKRAKALIEEKTAEKQRIYWVDLPNPNDIEESWINIAEFHDRDEAIAFCQKYFGADEEGRIDPIAG